MSRPAATLTGFIAIALWSLLALLTTWTGAVPPFQLLAVTFAVGGTLGLIRLALVPRAAAALRQPWPVWLLGIGGLFGYHGLYFAALKLAPPAEASLVNYLWPLLIVVFSGLILGERLGWHHLAGALCGLAGTVILALGGGGVSLEPAHLPGLVLALAAAVTWALYSVLSRRHPDVPSDAVTGFVLVTAVLAALCHALLERWVWPADGLALAAVILLGVGPVGIAFFVWDIGVKRGDIRLLGVASYAAPILSTLALVLGGAAEPSARLGLACLLIAGGALLAAKDVFRKPS